jgi:SAM-dependent methyltransferase
VHEESPLARARTVAAASRSTPIVAESHDEQYVLFEYAFYDPVTVARKQRIYIPYLQTLRGLPGPFLDLGCGRGEFLRIVREQGIETVGVDMNAVALGALQGERFEVVHADLLQFLANDTRTYCGVSALQVVEHLDAQQIERLLGLIAPRLIAGALLILETPNPLCPFALAQFHMDATHVAPIPPDRLRFSVEAAGFDDVSTLFQALAPAGFVVASDARAHYMDYAIIARRSAS